jgi:uncharacterized membrane protein YhfC
MNIAIRIINFSLMITIPFVLGLFLAGKLKSEWRLFGIGALTFISSQCFHIPFNYWVLNPIVTNLNLPSNFRMLPHAVIGLIFGLSAGLFEEVFRWVGFRFWIKGERDWKSALMFGAGHGGIESILLGVLALYGFIQALSLRGTDLNIVVGIEQAPIVQAQIDAYWAAPWHLSILGAVERFSTILFHLSASVFVLQVFLRKNILWLFLAVGWHTLVDAVAVFASRIWSPYITETIILFLGLLSLGFVFILKPGGKQRIQTPGMDQSDSFERPKIEIQQIKPSEEDLENSKYA